MISAFLVHYFFGSSSSYVLLLQQSNFSAQLRSVFQTEGKYSTFLSHLMEQLIDMCSLICISLSFTVLQWLAKLGRRKGHMYVCGSMCLLGYTNLCNYIYLHSFHVRQPRFPLPWIKTIKLKTMQYQRATF